MYNQSFFIPRYYGGSIPRMMYSPTMMRLASGMGRGSFFSRLASTFGTIKNLNWSGFINNTSKTLGIINQTIPLVRQAGPMLNNMRSMVKIASIFKDETDKNITNSKRISNNDNKYSNNNSDNVILNYDNSPTFFIN